MWTIIFFAFWQCNSFVMGNDDWLSDLSDESQLKGEKKAPQVIKKWKTHFYFMFNFWWLALIQATKVIWNPKKGPLSHHKNKILILDYV